MQKYSINTINQLEETIIQDGLYQIALDIGRKRKSHEEGQIGNHVISLLDYIDKNYSNDKDLRVVALLHDIGKLGCLLSAENKYIPLTEDGKEIQEEKKNFFRNACKEFRKLYHFESTDTTYIPEHALYSYEFAKKHFNTNWKTQSDGHNVPIILEIIKYHDSGFKFLSQVRKKGSYNKEQFKKIFLNKTQSWYEFLINFMYADNNMREKDTVIWLKEELQVTLQHKF